MFTFISLERTTRRMVVIAVVIFTILSFYGLYTAYAAGPALEITKDFGGATSLEVESGREFTYYIAYRCASITEDCNNVSVVDELPPELEYVEARGPIADVENISYNAGTHEVTFDFVDPLGAGTTGVLELSVRFPYGTLPGTTAVNDAVSWSNAIQFTSNETTATATGSFEMIANKIVTNDFDDAVIGAPFVTNYKLQACSPDPYGGVHLTNPTITDQLPVSATYLSSSHGGVYDPGTHSVTWTYISNGGGLPDVIPVVNGCGLTVDLDLLYHPDGPDGIPGNADDPIAGVTVTNNMTLEGDPEDGSAPVNLGDGVGVQLRDPYFEDGAGKSAASPSSYTGHGIEELPGGVVTYDLSYGNTGTITATNVILTDTIPSSLIVTSIDVQSAVDPIAGFYEVNSNPGVWLPFPDNNYIVNTSVPVTTTVTAVSGDIELNSGEYLTGVSFHLGNLPPDTSWTSTVNTIVNPALGPGVTIPNCIDTIATWNDNGTPAQASQHECTTVTTIDPRAIPRVGKSTSDDSLQPGDVAQFTLTAGNDAVAHNNVLTPITLVDLLPPEFELVIPDATQQSGYRLPTAPELTAGSWYSFTTTDSAPPPTHTYTPNFNGDDETLMRWEWTGAYEQEPGNVLTIRFYARIKDYMVPQTVGNQAIILTGPATVNPLGCTGGNLYTDAPDVDEDLDFTEEGCQFSAAVTIEPFLSLDSQKFVWGQLDPTWNDYGYTVSGGDVDYRIVITNTGNVTATNIVVYDILPYIGDTGVVDLSNRESAWRPNLQAPIVNTSGLPVTISYSQQQNPCRPEVMPSGPAGCVDDWSETPPDDITSVQSIRLEFCDSGSCAELTPEDGTGSGGSLEFTWHMVAPNDAPYDVVAWNSFGYTAEGGGLQLLPSEPIRVGIQLQENTTPGVSIGDYVWLDLYGDQDDGIQQPQEPGVNGVRVELWDNNAGSLVDYRITGPEFTGLDGYYLFVDIPAGDYFLRFFPPGGYSTSPANQGGNDGADSDGETSGTDPTYGDYVETAVFTVTIPNDDLDWDQGIWLPTDYGDAPTSYPTESASLGANPELAARHIISSTIYMGAGVDAETDGQPHSSAWGDDNDGNDDEDGVTFGMYLGTAVNPSGILIIGEDNDITIDTTAPVTVTGYLNAWMDFNADGDWDDPGEQIATDLAMSGGSETLTVSVPGTAVSAKTYARFRFSTEMGLLPTGTAANGEVEDYVVQFVPQPVKSIIDSSEAHTSASPSHLAIGEIIRYRLQVTVPEGTMTNFQIQDRLRSGLQFVNDGTADLTLTADTSITHDPLSVSGSPFNSGTDPIFELGTVVNNDNDADAELITIEFNALVLNESGNNNDTTANTNRRRNDFDVRYNNYTDRSNLVESFIVEPEVSIAKSVTTTPTDAGDTVVYELVATNNTGTYISNAYDLTITDTLDSNLTMVSAVVSAKPGYATAVNNSNILANLVDVDIDQLNPGDSVTITVTALVKSTTPTGETIPNTAYLVFSSLPDDGTTGNSTGTDTPGSSGDPDGERNGSGGVNKYADNDSGDVDLAEPAVDKQVSPTDYTIGEEITFDILVTLPEGVTEDLVVTDDLPDGLEYISYQVIETAAGSGGLLATDFAGSLPVPADNTPVTGSGSNLVLTFGDTTTTGDNDTTNNNFLIQVTAVVLDIYANQNGDTLTNTAVLEYTRNGSSRQRTDDVDVNLVEPVLAIDKLLVSPIPSPLDAGTVITYHVVLQHDAATAADAYDVVITDTLPSELINSSLVGVTASGIANPGGDLTGGVLRVPAAGTFDLPQGAVVTATFTAEIGGTAVSGQPITNKAGAVWTTLPGTPAEERHGGGTDPDGGDFLDGGAVDDYEIEDPAPFTVDAPSFVKALQATSAGHTSGSNVTIGEIVTYSMTVTLAEGTIPSLQVVDDLPAGLAFVSGSDAIDDTGFNGTIPAYTLTAPGGSGDNVTFDWGAFTVPADNDPNNNSFVLEIKAVVVDVPGNIGVNPPGQTDLINTATVQVGSGTPESSNPVDVTVVEPQMEIVKSFSVSEASPNDTITVTLTVTNTGTSTAFEVIVEDPLPTDTYINVTEGSTPAGFSYALVSSGSDNVVTYTGGSVPVGGSVEFTFTVTLHPDLAPSPPDLDNIAIVTQATTLDSTDPTDGDDAQERDEPDAQDDDQLTIITPDLVLTKTNSVTYVAAGDLIVYDIMVENVGGADAEGVVITETVPADTTFDLANSSATWVGCADNAATGTVCVLTIGDLASGADTTVQFAVEIDDPLPLLTAVISNTAVTDDDGTHGIDPTPTNNEDDHQDTVIAAIGDYVWEDLDADGVQNDGNTGINGVTVKLYRDVDGDGIAEPGGDDGVPISTTLTADSGGGDPGYYLFDKLIPGDYFVEFVKPSGYEESVRDVGGDAADSDPNIGTGVTIVTTLTGGEIDLTWDAGFFRPVSIGSFVWEDRNDNGVQDAAEPGIAGATVALLVDNGGFVTAVDVNGNTVSNQTTGADGLYQFTNLPPGDYRVRVTPPADYLPATTQTTTDDDGSESDSNIADEPVSGTYESGTFTLTIDGEPTESGSYAGDAQDDAGDANGNMTVDFGFFQPLSLGSFVWIDANGDGLQDVGETGIENATVALLVYDGISAYVPAVDVDGVLVSAQSTGLDGLYQFENLPLGDYRVRVTPPANYLPSLTQNGSDDDNSEDDSNIADEPVAGTYESGTFTLTSSGEPVESGSFAGDDQDDGRDNDGNMTIDFGFIEPLSIGSLVWEDLDGDGVQDGGEPGIGGAAVALLVDNGAGSFVPATDVDGSLIPGQNTPANGTYRFENLPPGDYRVRVTLPSAYAPTLIQTAVNNDNSEDDSNIADEPIAGTYESGTFTLSVGGEPTESGSYVGDDQDNADDTNGNMTVDFGFIQAVSLGSFVWEDQNGDGLQTGGEPGLAGAVVALFVDAGSGTFIPAVDIGGTAVFSQTTAADGRYHFTNLPPGDYRVRVTPAGGYVPTPTQTAAGNDDTENDSNIADEPTTGTYESGTFTLILSGEPSETGAFTGDDQDDLREADGNMTVDFGFVPVVSLGSFVWEDLDGDGVQEAGEPGIVGATVSLFVDNGSGTFVAATDVNGTAVSGQTTLADGFYFFDNLPEGDYKVQVTPPAGYTPTRNQETAANNDTENDSNIAAEPVAGTYESGIFTLSRDGESVESNTRDGDGQDDTIGAKTDDDNGNMTVDFGFFQPVAVGNVVWIDDGAGAGTANNGMIDGSEAGIADVIVELYWATDTPGTDAPFMTTTTNSSGEYLFDIIPTGDYVIHIPASEFAVGEPLVSFISSVGNGGDDGVDDNLNENGADQLDPAMTGVSSAIVNLVPGSEPTGETGQGSYGGTLADADVDMSIDFGFFELLTLGNRVWFDADNNGIIDDGSNPGAANVVMNLLDQNGDPVLHPITGLPITTTTTVDGYYLFTGLLPGDYIVQVAPENFQPGGVLEFFLNSTGSADPDNDVDSDDNGNDGANLAIDGVSCDPVTLDYDLEPDNNLDTDDNNNTNLSVDFGFYLDPTAVTLISFTAVSQQAKSVQITWQTGTEIDNYGFELWRSKEGVWETAVKIHTEPAVGTGTGAIYRYQDSVPANGTWYYWLVDVDTNDVKATHGPVSVVVKPLYQLFMPIVVR